MNDLPGGEIPRPLCRSERSQTGFSLIEVLMAMGLLVIAVVGLLPLFSRSVLENLEGKEATVSTNHVRSELETIKQLPLNSWEMDIPVGDSERVTTSEWTRAAQSQIGDESWEPSAAPGELVPWTRTTRVRQFGINGVADTDLDGVIDRFRGLEDADLDGEFDDVLVGGTSPSAIHLKEVRVEVEASKQWSQAGAPAANEMRLIKAF